MPTAFLVCTSTIIFSATHPSPEKYKLENKVKTSARENSHEAVKQNLARPSNSTSRACVDTYFEVELFISSYELQG